MEPFAILVIILLFAAHFVLNIVSHLSYKKSAISKGAKRFISWQAVAQTTGFLGVLATTGLFHYLPTSIAYPITQGLGVVGVQFIAAMLFFKERITLPQWIGTAFIIIGVILVGSAG